MKQHLEYERSVRDRHADRYFNVFSRYELLYQWSFLKEALGDRSLGRVLDLGCGVGRFAKNLTVMAQSYTGLDFSHRSLATLQREKLPGCTLVEGDALALPLADECFDTVFSSEILEQFLDPTDVLQYLREAKRVCRPGGVIVMSTFNYSLMCRLTGDRMRIDSQRGANFVRYSKLELLKILRAIFTPGEVRRIRGLLSFNHFPMNRLGGLLPEPLRYQVDRALSCTPLGAALGHLLVITLEKESRL